jgi:hypothetical protein
MPRVRVEPTIQEFERVKAVHALDRVAIVIGLFPSRDDKISSPPLLGSNEHRSNTMST